MDRRAWQTTVHGATKSWTQLSNEAQHTSIFPDAWEIPWAEEIGGLQSMGVTKESDTTQQLNNSNPHTKSSELSRY